MGGHPLEALALLGLGIERLSITPASVGPIKAMVRSTNLADIKLFMKTMLTGPQPNPRQAIQNWADEHDIDVG